jgi:hypothetical protein
MGWQRIVAITPQRARIYRKGVSMGFKILADLMVLFHFLWILFLFLGFFWGIRFRTVRLFHLFGLALAFYIQLFDRYCPLTHLELYFRSRHAPISYYSGSFIIYYMEKIIYLQVPQIIVLIATVFLCIFNLLYYLGYFRKKGNNASVNGSHLKNDP